jgi:hypothetical protein
MSSLNCVFIHQYDRPDLFVILYCFLSEDAGIEPKTVAMFALAVTARSHPLWTVTTLFKSVLLIWITVDKKLIFCSFFKHKRFITHGRNHSDG